MNFFLISVILLSSLFSQVDAKRITKSNYEIKLHQIHSKIRLLHGSLAEEYPEQLLSVQFLFPEAKVLELGGNVGRNSCVIASILDNSSDLVVLESSPESAKLLQENRDHNGFKFHIEVSALSQVPLIQNGWQTIPGDEVLPGYNQVNTLTFKELLSKYNIQFDTLIADCEGALYYILRDDPDMLSEIKLIITENDYTNIEHLKFVQKCFITNGFELIYNLAGGWPPCNDEFYQVWKKKT